MTTDTLVSVEDRLALDDLIARYYWAFDGGDADAYADLWVEDGQFGGFGEPITGIAALKRLVLATQQQSKGLWSHHFTNAIMRYAGSPDRVTARGYLTVTRSGEAPGVQMAIKGFYDFVRRDGDWKVASVEVQFGS